MGLSVLQRHLQWSTRGREERLKVEQRSQFWIFKSHCGPSRSLCPYHLIHNVPCIYTNPILFLQKKKKGVFSQAITNHLSVRAGDGAERRLREREAKVGAKVWAGNAQNSPPHPPAHRPHACSMCSHTCPAPTKCCPHNPELGLNRSGYQSRDRAFSPHPWRQNRKDKPQ